MDVRFEGIDVELMPSVILGRSVVVILGRSVVVITVAITGSITEGGLIAVNRPYAHNIPCKYINRYIEFVLII